MCGVDKPQKEKCLRQFGRPAFSGWPFFWMGGKGQPKPLWGSPVLRHRRVSTKGPQPLSFRADDIFLLRVMETPGAAGHASQSAIFESPPCPQVVPCSNSWASVQMFLRALQNVADAMRLPAVSRPLLNPSCRAESSREGVLRGAQMSNASTTCPGQRTPNLSDPPGCHTGKLPKTTVLQVVILQLVVS